MNDAATAAPRPPGLGHERDGVADDIAGVLAVLLGSDPAVVEHDELAVLVESAARVRGWLDAFDVSCARRARELHEAGRGDSPTSLFTRHARHSSREAAQIEQRMEVLDAMTAGDAGSDDSDIDAGGEPCVDGDSFTRALREHRVSNAHVDALADAMRRLDDDARAVFVSYEAELLAAAATQPADVFARRCRELARRVSVAQATSDAEELDRQRANSSVKRWVDKVTGMCHTHLELDPIRDARLHSAVDSALAMMIRDDANVGSSWGQMQVDAFVTAVTAGFIGDAVAGAAGDDAVHMRRAPEITLLADLQTLVDGLHERGVCETADGMPIPVSTLRRLCCDAEIIPVLLGADGVPLDVGRSSRSVTAQQRRALRAMYRTCGHPDCTVGFSNCKAHHVRWWWRDLGPTDLSNLIPLCDHHHHLVHEGGWELAMSADRITTWTRPDGTIAHHGRTTDRIDAPSRRPV
jgi:hypothetical protein